MWLPDIKTGPTDGCFARWNAGLLSHAPRSHFAIWSAGKGTSVIRRYRVGITSVSFPQTKCPGALAPGQSFLVFEPPAMWCAGAIHGPCRPVFWKESKATYFLLGCVRVFEIRKYLKIRSYGVMAFNGLTCFLTWCNFITKLNSYCHRTQVCSTRGVLFSGSTGKMYNERDAKMAPKANNLRFAFVPDPP